MWQIEANEAPAERFEQHRIDEGPVRPRQRPGGGNERILAARRRGDGGGEASLVA
jgi:hypothetical protein